jgi:putative membrane protein
MLASPGMTASHRRYALVLAGLFVTLWVALAIQPLNRRDWLLENLLVFALVPVLVLTRKRLPLSRVSYTLIFVFLCVHEIGAHYTYGDVPYDALFQAVTGRTLNGLLGWQRNHFDRLAHFLYGLLLAYPIREVFLRVADVRGFWGYLLPLDFTMSTSMMFELIEWLVASMVADELAAQYLGTQGDIWDAHKDMALASFGALLAMTVTALINVRLRRDFAREWAESLRVKHPKPLGEVEIKRLRQG